MKERVESRITPRILVCAIGVMELPFIEMGRTGGAGLGGELRAVLFVLGRRYQWTCKGRSQVGSWVGLLIFMSFSFLICVMGKVFAYRILEIK